MLRTSFDIKEPGINALPLGVERYVVEGGGDIYVRINNKESLGKYRQKLLKDPITKKKVKL